MRSIDVLFDPFNDYVYVSNSMSGTISIISPQMNAPKVYTVEFLESGLSNGTSWGITFDGILKNSSSGSLEFFALNGTYSYTVANVSGYVIENYTPEVKVAGSNVTSQIYFNKKVVTTPRSSLDEYILTASVIVVAIVAISIYTIKKKKVT